MEPAIVLLSGGLDSATALAVAQSHDLDCLALSFRYGQSHEAEVAAATAIAERAGVRRHVIVDIDLRVFGGSALTSDLAIPKHDADATLATGIPVTYVPARNTIFLSYALAFAEVSKAARIVIGVNAVDYSGYPDCRPEYIAAFERMANLATKAAVQDDVAITIDAPLIDMSKAEIVRLGTELGVDYSATVSCYDADLEGRACGRCDSCILRRRGFEEAGIDDPTRYVLVRMTYRVKETFLTLQGEGINAGRTAVFCRFAGCNLWSGREVHRSIAICKFCDTDFVGVDGVGGGRFATSGELADHIEAQWRAGPDQRLVVFTGGEPLLQLDEELLHEVRNRGFESAIETNGTLPVPPGVDWVCVSPKARAPVVVTGGHELKFVYPQAEVTPEDVQDYDFEHFLLQPMDGDNRVANTSLAIEYCLTHPRWRLSIQSHKYLGIP